MPAPAARRVVLLSFVGIGVPCAVLARPPAVVIDRVLTLQEVVEAEGWTVTPTQSGIYKPGAVLVPNARGTHDVVATGCVEAEPEVELMSQSSIASSLKGGVKGSFGAGSAAASAGITKQLTFIDPEQRTIPLGRLKMTPACRADVEGAAKLRDLRDAVIVHDVLVAIVKNTVCKRVEASGKVVALGEADAAGFSDCVQESAGQVPVGFKAVRLSLLSGAPTVAPVVAPVAAPVVAPGLAVAAPPPVDLGRGWVAPSDYAMRRVPAGEYSVGCTPGQGDACADDERPLRVVTLSRALWVGETEVTQALYERVVGRRPSYARGCGPTCPVERVSWTDAAEFANALSEAEGLEACYEISRGAVSWPKGPSCAGFRLPTEAEWEVAARGGGDARFAGGDTLAALAWFDENSGGQVHPVGLKAANGYGLFDMSGNVWEWVWDWFDERTTASVAGPDPMGPAAGTVRGYRGGSAYTPAARARVSFRDYGAPDLREHYLGVRLVRTAD